MTNFTNEPLYIETPLVSSPILSKIAGWYLACGMTNAAQQNPTKVGEFTAEWIFQITVSQGLTEGDVGALAIFVRR